MFQDTRKMFGKFDNFWKMFPKHLTALKWTDLIKENLKFKNIIKNSSL